MKLSFTKAFLFGLVIACLALGLSCFSMGHGGGGDKGDKNKDKPASSSISKSTDSEKSEGGRLKKFTQPYSDSAGSSRPEPDHGDDYHEHHYYNNDRSDYDDDDGGGFWLGDLFADRGYRYSSYPYNDPGQEGIYLSYYPLASLYYENMAIQFRYYYQPIENNLQANGFYGKLLLGAGSTIDTFYSRYSEKLDGRTDTVDYFSLHWNLASLTPDTNTMIEIGAGGGYLTDVDGVTHGSFSVQAKCDYFPAKPLGIHLTFGYSAPAGQALYNINTALGWHIKSLELFLGYHFLINSQGDDLSGPTMGAAVWF